MNELLRSMNGTPETKASYVTPWTNVVVECHPSTSLPSSCLSFLLTLGLRVGNEMKSSPSFRERSFYGADDVRARRDLQMAGCQPRPPEAKVQWLWKKPSRVNFLESGLKTISIITKWRDLSLLPRFQPSQTKGYLPLGLSDDGSGVLGILTEGVYMDYYVVAGEALEQMKELYKPDGVLSHHPDAIAQMAEDEGVDGQGAGSLPEEYNPSGVETLQVEEVYQRRFSYRLIWNTHLLPWISSK